MSDENNSINTRSRGIKKSKFPGNKVIPNGSFFDFVVDGTNFRILDTDFFAALGVTGSIVADGDPTGSPILDKQGSINIIRNIEPGFGIATEISSENGVEISTDFTFNEVGTTLVDDPQASAAIFRSLVAGTGINVVGTDGEIQIAVSAIPASTKTVIIAEKSDLPAPIIGVITLTADRNYFFTDDVDLGTDRLVLNGNVISAADSSLIQLTYTGTGVMITDIGNSSKITKIKLSCPNGTLTDIQGGGVGVFQMLDMTVKDCKSIGTWDALRGAQMNNVSFDSLITTGVLFTGSHGIFLNTGSLVNLLAGTFLDLGTATFDGFSFTSSFPTIAGGSTMVSGLANNGNINTGGFATIHEVIQGGSGAALSGITSQDAQWQFDLCNTIPDTRPDALASFNTPTDTVITTVNTPVLVTGVWTIEPAVSQFTITAGGRITFNGVKNATLPISISANIEAVTGSNKNITIHLFKNGSQVTNANGPNKVSSNDPKSTSIMWQLLFEPGDFIELFVENNTDNVNLTVNKASIRIN